MSADRELVAALLSNLPRTAMARNYVVSRIDIAGAPDGSDQVYIAVGDDDLPVPRLARYSAPTLGDVVHVVTINGSPMIHDLVLGLAPAD